MARSAADGLWPFDQPRNCVTITHWSILSGAAPILCVSHDEDDHGWQFLDGSNPPDIEAAAVVVLAEIVKLDPSVLAVADLPPGHQAWRRSKDALWERSHR